MRRLRTYERLLWERRRKDRLGMALVAAEVAFFILWLAMCVHLDHVRGISVAQDLASWGL